MREKLHTFLTQRRDAASSEELLAEIFPDGGEDRSFGREFLQVLLSGDLRFVAADDGARWHLSDGNLLELPIAQGRFVVVDLETTGQSPGATGITEIGALRLEGGREVARFDTLVNPGRPIPPYVAKLTGITDAMVAEAPSIEKIAPDFFDFAQDAVLVAHNAAFDAALLDQICRRLLGRPLGLPSLCTLKLTRRLMPELAKASLDALADHFALTSQARHRAMADAELTAAVLERLVERLDGIRAPTVADLLAAQEGPSGRAYVELHLCRRSLEKLPHAPGVYWLTRADGSALYVSSAHNLRHDVLEGYLNPHHLSDRQRAMLSEATDIGFRPTHGALERSLVLAEELRRRKPDYNRGDKHLPRGFFVKVSGRGAFPRVHVSGRIARDGGTYLGPIKGKSFAEDAASLLARLYALRTCPGPLRPDPDFEACELSGSGSCSSPCNDKIGRRAYADRVDELLAAMAGDGGALYQRIEQCAKLGLADVSRDGGTISRLLKINRRQSWIVNRQNYVVAVPFATGPVLLMAVLGGFCRRSAQVSRADEIASFTASIDAAALKERRKLGAFEADASTILAHWIRSRDDEDVAFVVDLDPGDLRSSADAAAEQLGVVLAGLV
jgi:DNA polymerase-3 subunit epsilon